MDLTNGGMFPYNGTNIIKKYSVAIKQDQHVEPYKNTTVYYIMRK